MPDTEPPATGLQQKIIEHFEGKVVRKDLTQQVKGNAIVPSYVLDYLLGQYCTSSDEQLIRHGVEKVRSIISEHYVHRDAAELVKSKIREKESHKIIDRVSVSLNDKRDVHEAAFSNLGLRHVEISSDIVSRHQKLLTGGVWCIVDMAYLYTEDSKRPPWIVDHLKPIQLSYFDLDEYTSLRQKFSKEEWIDLLLQSIGLNPEPFSYRSKLFQLLRLIPFCERNYNFMELGPKGTGKSHIFSEFSPHGILISGGEVTKAKLFVNNNTGDIGLVGYWDVVAFDEFAGQKKRTKRDVVDIMKNYMANKSFSRGRDVMSAEASMAFIGNTDRSVAYMIKNSDLFEALPSGYYDPAFLDRLHFYLPGWEVDKLRSEMFTDGYGFIVDYLAEGLHTMRGSDYSLLGKEHFELDSSLTKRDRDGAYKTLSGLLKIIYPGKRCSREDVCELLEFSIEGRRRVKDQLLRIDETFEPVSFRFVDRDTGEEKEVETLEYIEYHQLVQEYEAQNGFPGEGADGREESASPAVSAAKEEELESGRHIVIKENQKGVSYEKLFAGYMKNASKIEIIDPYVRLVYQVKNVMEFCNMLLRIKPEGEEVELSLLTGAEEGKTEEMEEHLEGLKQSLSGTGIHFQYEITWEGIHARSITTDTGWKITLDRGLDIFQPYDFKNTFNMANINQEQRLCKPFEVTYLREEQVSFEVD